MANIRLSNEGKNNKSGRSSMMVAVGRQRPLFCMANIKLSNEGKNIKSGRSRMMVAVGRQHLNELL